MNHYEERLEHDLNRIKERVGEMADKVQDGVENAVHALVAGDRRLAYNVILQDLPINRHMRRTERLCNAFLATHKPTAHHLRLISAVVRTIITLERIGDHAVSICREAVQLSQLPDAGLIREIELIADETRSVLGLAVYAFNQENADKAEVAKASAIQSDRTFGALYSNLLDLGQARSTKDLFALFVIFSLLRRISDQAKNICEDVIYAATGSAKTPKIYKILFIDEDNSCLGPMAEAIAGKRFPALGEYTSVGRKCGPNFNEYLPGFLAEQGMDLPRTKPRTLDLVPSELAAFHVIVSLQGPVDYYIKEVPFHTVALEWDVGNLSEELDQEMSARHLEEIRLGLDELIQGLMETLRGEET